MDWAARPITIDAKPAATNKEDINPLVPGKAVKVVDATPNKGNGYARYENNEGFKSFYK